MSKCWMTPSVTRYRNKIRVALPVCNNDADLMLLNLDWQEELDGRKDFDCVLTVDGSVPTSTIKALEIAAWRTFSEVNVLVYPTAPIQRWPNGPNWAFQQTARYIQKSCRPWFWMEPDCVPINPGWLNYWNQEYFDAGKAIMGVIIEGMGHCNGTAIYPAHFPSLSPESMSCTDVAWDGLMKKRTIQHTHNASHLMCHVWGITNGKALPFGGTAAHFDTWNDVKRWVDLGAVLFHRAKDGSLIERMREQLR